MYIVKGYPDGLFCWVDLTTNDVGAAKAFYNGLFGWEYEDVPTDLGPVYSICQLEGKNVAGMGPMSPDLLAQGIPPFWSSYIKHSNVDAIAAKVTEAGGMLLMPPMDVMETGRMLMATDPTGATFGVWQPKNHIGAQLVNMPNTLFWNELQTRDAETARTFYQAVFDWEYSVDANNYTTVKSGGRTQAGMLVMDESWGPIPPNWAEYFLVEDVAASAEKVKELGGNLRVSPTQAGELGRFSVAQDPQGAFFTIMQFDGPVDLPPGADEE